MYLGMVLVRLTGWAFVSGPKGVLIGVNRDSALKLLKAV